MRSSWLVCRLLDLTDMFCVDRRQILDVKGGAKPFLSLSTSLSFLLCNVQCRLVISVMEFWNTLIMVGVSSACLL